jgi:hypothetical protein
MVFLGSTHFLVAQLKTDFAMHPLFKHLIGDWKSEGTFKNAAGAEVKITEEWSGKAASDDEFVMEGVRFINGERQEYKWTFTHNSTTGLYEATHAVTTNGGETKRFEASISDADLTMELLYVGNGLSSISVKDSFPGTDRNTLESIVKLTGESGETDLSGKMTHVRVQKP